MNIPEQLLYTTEHLWLRAADDGSWLTGITDYAQDLLGDIVYVEAPAVGTAIKSGMACGLVESVKTGSDLHAPIDGVVEAINDALAGAPEKINDAPYDSWIFRLRPSDLAQLQGLLNAAKYREFLG
ncbi:MAG TPA: glycine cleavage system protein GcvH [Methylophilaceae bacterium]|nr:glycine cleavage system protein GcvH [Methylophilaceae bacterium]